jgi:hypothetical protein
MAHQFSKTIKGPGPGIVDFGAEVVRRMALASGLHFGEFSKANPAVTEVPLELDSSFLSSKARQR